MLTRRRFLESALAGASLPIVGCSHSTGDLGTSSAGLEEGRPLRTLQSLANESDDPREFSAALIAAPTQAALTPGQASELWLYNGAAPGPLIELIEGQRVRIAFVNNLPQASTIHWHGMPVPPTQDGNPMDPVAAGTGRSYEYEITKGMAGTYWYHPHPHLKTAEQVSRGLAGPIIIRAPDDPLAHLQEVTLFITGLRLDAGAQVAPDDAIDWTIGRQRELLLVNGGRLPVHSVRPGTTQRWRVVNATAARHIRLALEGHELTLVGTDGGLLAAPIAGLPEIIVAPAQRVEVLVTANASPNGRYRLRALQYQADFLGLGTYADADLLTLETTNELPAPPASVPASLRAIEDLGEPAGRQLIELSEVTGMCMSNGATTAFLINGRIFSLDRVDLETTAGRVELWDIVNLTSMPHPFHVHGTQFQLVSRQIGTVSKPAPYLAWIDTVLVPVEQTATIKIRQTVPGKRMFHCHILEHEDNCMMAILDVRPS